jgi:uncharacterized protein
VSYLMSADPTAAPPHVRLRIGVTGHRVPPKLPEQSETPLRTQIIRIFAAFAAAARNIENTYMAHVPARDAALARDFTVVSSLAEGSDRIVAEAGLIGSCKLEVVLPLKADEYVKDFETAKSREQFDALLARASQLVDLDGSPAERPRAYEAAGLFMLENIDVLIAIWDGEVAAGIGGTAQIVERAIADGIMVLWIEPTHPHAVQISYRGPHNPALAVNADNLKETFRPADEATIAQAVQEILEEVAIRQDTGAAGNAAGNPIASSFENSRDHHFFGPGPKRLLALDGGGVRGALTVAFLERIETLLTERYGKEVRLGDYFDFIGGTSTGAIIAGALALGYRTEQVKDFYVRLAPSAFKGSRWRIPVLQAKFDASGLRTQIEAVVGNRVLKSADLITGYCLITKRMDTGSPWIIANNPRAPYWKSPGHGEIGNEDYPLVNLVRASTAAPHFFDPELLPISRNEAQLPDAVAKPLNVSPARFIYALLERVGLRHPAKIDSNNYGLFVDGGVTPHNNPSLALFQMATLKPFKIEWPTGTDKLTIMSVGTGTYRPRLSYKNLGFARFTKLALHALISMMNDAEVLVMGLMQWMGECPAPWVINSEVGTLADVAPPGGKLFRFLRYDVRLEKEWLARELDVQVTDDVLERLRGMDDPSMVDQLYEIGRQAAEKQVKPEHLF